MKDTTRVFNSAELRQAASIPDESIFARIAPILVFVALVVGAGLRLNGLVDHTIDHNEIYVPGVKLPDDLSIPESRLTLYRTIHSTIITESHPPGYYLLMLPWTRCFGYNPLAIRLPSAIMGAATILLLYLLGARLGLRKAGVLASFLWATAGLPIFLSQEARMYPLTCFLGVLATVLLVESYRGNRSYQRLIIGAYIVAILAGLSSSHFFWPILIAHILYVQLGPIPSGRREAPQARWQLFAMALASPLLAVAVFQSGRPSYLSPDVWSSVQAYFRLLYVWYSGETLMVASWLAGVTSLGCALLLVIGVLRMRRQVRADNQNNISCPSWLLYMAVVLAFVSIEAFAWITHHREFSWLERRTGAIIACGAIPLLVLIADFVTRRGLFAGWLESRFGAPLGPVWLVIFLAVVPVGLLALVSVAVPLIADRTVSIFGPYLMLVVSMGAVSLGRMRIAHGLAVVLLLLLNIAGFLEYRREPHSPTDYSTLAAQVAPKKQAGDLWFIFKHWATTPIFYYLKPEQHIFVARDYDQILSERPRARVWVLGFEGLPPSAEVTAPLSSHRRLVHVEASGIYTDLYIPISDDDADKTDAGDSDVGLH